MHGVMPVNPSSARPALDPPDEHRVAETVRSKLPFRGEFAHLTPLTGDASNRRYYRVELDEGVPTSVILMQLADPEAFKESEEAVGGGGPVLTEVPFINVRRHLAKAEVAVPKLYYYDERAGLLYLEDFGDLTLTEACRVPSDS